MRIALLNMPNAWPVMRRYMCSTRAENYLFPPQELMYLAAVAKKEGHEVKLLDAIAEKTGYEETVKELRSFKPELVATITGFECFENDMNVIQKIKKDLPKAKTVCFGYYPSLFPKEIMQKTNIDFIILGEPEPVFIQLLKRVGKTNTQAISGLCFRKNGKPVISQGMQRITDLDSLPLPLHEILKQGLYSEPFLGKPYSAIQSSRGCPFQCTYCVSTYGKQIAFRSSKSIMQEIKMLARLGIKNFRFIDDTFTVNRQRVIDLCDSIAESNLKVKWTCLSRLDTIDKEMLGKMKKAGCRRIFLGIESGSQKVLDWFKKGYKAEQLLEKINAVSDAGIESLGFFIVGSPPESEYDFQKSLDLALQSKLNYVVVSRLLAYPGTELFQKMRKGIDFSLFPYKNEFLDKSLEKRWIQLEKRFYKAFYLRPSYIVRRALTLLKNPKEFLLNAKNFLYYLLKPAESERQDMF